MRGLSEAEAARRLEQYGPNALPKTRSGKIMRRLLKEIAGGATEVKGDISTLEDLNVVASLGRCSRLVY